MMELEQILDCNYNKWQSREYIYEKVEGNLQKRNSQEGNFQAVTYGEFLDHTRSLADHLISLGLLDKPVMIYGDNSIELMAADFAVLHYVGISVWVPKEWKAADVLQSIRLLKVPCIIYGEEKQDIVRKIADELPSLICIPKTSLRAMRKTIAKNISIRNTKTLLPRSENLCCKIVFSSGTTASPKAVMLSKKNIFAGIHSLYKRCPFDENDVDYLFLPLSHTYGGIYNFLYSLIFGFCIYLCSDIRRMEQEILEVNPTLFCGVPAVYRRFYERYGSNIHTAFGNRIQYLFCGGAYFDERIRKAYKDSGLNMMEAYGLSETASTFSIQYPKDPDTHSVGTIAEDIDVKVIHEDSQGIGEIVVKGDNVFMGYAGNKELTAAAFTEDGYFRTGDLGRIETDEKTGGRRVYLTGRIKKLLIGENGENIDPAHIEELIYEKNANIRKALLYLKDGKLSCHIYLARPENRDWEMFFQSLNAALPGNENIKHYDITMDSMETRLKQ